MSTDIRTELQNHYVLFCVEGTAEGVVINKLVDAGFLLVPTSHIVKDRMTFKPFTRTRKAKDIAEHYLDENYQLEASSKLLIARIIDSDTPKFILPHAYKETAIVRNFITAPEIEMLVIYKENATDLWLKQSRKNKQLKPCEFCKQKLGMKDIKSAVFLNEYWSDAEELANTIRQYAQKHSKQGRNNFTLADLLL